ncbi:MAG: caspase family protein [Thermoplasmata archaeon]
MQMRSRLVAVTVTAILMVSFAAVPLASAADIPDGQKWALLIGISDYGPYAGYGDLTYCHKDALDMYKLLVMEGWMPSHIKVLTNESATRANIVAGISWLSANSVRGMALFFYSGHGSFFADKWAVPDKDESNDQCIMPYDSDLGDYSTLIFDDQLRDYFAPCKASQTVFIFDCCYAAGQIDELGKKGRLIMAGADVHQMSYEGGMRGCNIPIENGVYTYCILQAMTGAGDANGDGTVSLEEAAAYAAIAVQEYTQNVRAVTYDGISGEAYL